MTDPRVLVCDAIHNFRDYGGYRAGEGTLRSGVLWRSGQHAAATAADLARVRALGLATVIDLRGDSERAAYPCLRPDEFAGTVRFFPGETSGQAGRAAHEAIADGLDDAAAADAAMLRLYRAMPFRPVLVGSWRLYFDTLANSTGPSLIHCLAGKDRTGVAVALAQHALGVHRDDIVADYCLTNRAGDVEARIAAQSAALSGRGLSEAALRVILSVDPAWLDAAFAAIIAEHGSVDGYLRDVLGLTDPLRAAMAARLIV